MEVVLTRLRDFSCKSSTFDHCEPVEQRARRDLPGRDECCKGAAEVRKVDIESALAWLKRELVEMRTQDQALIRQMMELHSGIQELKQEFSEEEEEEEGEEDAEDEEDHEQDEDEEMAHFWDSGSEEEISHISWSSTGSFNVPFWKTQPVVLLDMVSPKLVIRRSSVP